MYPVLCRLGPLSIHAYGFMVALAFFVAILVSLRYAKKEGLNGEQLLDLPIYIIIAAIVGARILYVVGAWGEFKDNLFEIFLVYRGGLVFLGGLFLGLCVIFIYARVKKIPLLKLLDLIMPGGALGYAIARIGCFLNDCCFGLPTKMPWGLEFPFGSLAYSYYPRMHIHPTQLYSSASLLLVFAILVYLYPRKKFDGYIFFWALIFYSVYRFIVEFFRYSSDVAWGLHPAQWFVLAIGALAAFGLVYKSLKARV